jgi:hypothetical protein
MAEISSSNVVARVEVSRLLPFAFLAPKIAAGIVAGDQPIELTAHRLSRVSDLPHAGPARVASGLLTAIPDHLTASLIIALPNTWLRHSPDRDRRPRVRRFGRSPRRLSQVLSTTRR